MNSWVRSAGEAATAERELETARTRGFDEGKLALPRAQAYFAQGVAAGVRSDTPES